MSTAVGEGARDGVAPAWSLRRVVTAAVIGNVLEWYDFAVYGFFAPILASQFFPAGDRVVSLLAAFAAFAVGFLMRPVGAALFGYIGDRYGRARALFMSIAMMAIPTVLMGLLPTYATHRRRGVVPDRAAQDVPGHGRRRRVHELDRVPRGELAGEAARLLRELRDVRRDVRHDARLGGRRVA